MEKKEKRKIKRTLHIWIKKVKTNQTKKTWPNAPDDRKKYLGYCLEGLIHHDRESWQHWQAWWQEKETSSYQGEIRESYLISFKLLKPIKSHYFSSSRKVKPPNLYQILPITQSKKFKYLSIWETFHIKSPQMTRNFSQPI